MRKLILITFGLLLTTMLQAQSWQIKPWQKYLIDEQVKQDTAITCQSVMGLPSIPKPFETRLYRTVTGSEMIGNLPHYKKKSKSFLGYNDSSPSLFEEQREQEKQKILKEDSDLKARIQAENLAQKLQIVQQELEKIKS